MFYALRTLAVDSITPRFHNLKRLINYIKFSQLKSHYQILLNIIDYCNYISGI